MSKIVLTLPDGKQINAAAGKNLFELSHGSSGLILAAKLDGRLTPLDTVPERSARLEWVTYSDKPGLEIYQRSASFILNMAVAELSHNIRLVIGHSISNGFYYDFYCGIPVTQELLNGITAKMREIISRDLPFRRRLLPRDEAIRLFCQPRHERQPAPGRKLQHRPGPDL